MCTFEVDKQSACYFKKWLKLVDGMAAHLEIRFRGNTYNSTNDVLFPRKWLWTFVPPGGGDFYISWPVDYFIFSFGLLDTQTLRGPVILNMRSLPSDCTITFGSKRTIKEIGDAMYNMSVHYRFFEINQFYDYSYWCYTSTNANFKDSMLKNLNKYLGVPIPLYGYKCCYNDNEKRKVICETKDADLWDSYQLLPFYIGIIFFLYFPVSLMKCGKCAVDSGKEICSEEYSHLTEQEAEYIFMRTRSPITVSKLFFGLFGLAEKHPVLASRIRRILFVCFAPIIVYLFMILYYNEGQSLMEELVRHKIPAGFVSVIGGFKESMDLYLPMFGGPAISLILYVVIGSILLLIPRDIGEILELGLPPDTGKFSTLLKMNLETIAKYSKTECRTHRGYHKIYNVMRGNIYMLINPQFWYNVAVFHLNRWRSIVKIFCPCCCRKVFRIIICFPVFTLYTCFCILETVLMYIYNGMPVCFFVFSVIRGYARYFRRTQRFRSILAYAIISIIVPICFLFYIYMLVMITLESFTIIGYFVYFIYLSLVIFPGRSFGFVYYVIMFILYILNVVKYFKDEYKELLNNTIKASIKLRKSHMAMVYINDRTESNPMTIIALANIVPTEDTNPLLSIQNPNGCEYVKYKKQIPGIRKKLFNYVVDRHHPVHIAFFHIIVQIVVVQIFVLASIVFISKYIQNVRSREASEVLNVMSVVIVTMIPNLIRIVFLRVHDKKVQKRKVRQIVIDFWKKENQSESENI